MARRQCVWHATQQGRASATQTPVLMDMAMTQPTNSVNVSSSCVALSA